MTETKQHVFISGSAGTGKTTLIEHLRKHSGKAVITVAPTGAAAKQVNGSTIHSFFQLPHVMIMPDDENIKWANYDKKELLANIDTIIIDEISMVRADSLDGMDQYLRRNLRDPRPFGGKQVVMVGDVFQLEPVLPKEVDVAALFAGMYESGYFFSSHVFARIKPAYFNLTHIYRQKDKAFIDILNRIRMGEHTMDDIRHINSRCAAGIVNAVGRDETEITICSRNKSADAVNNLRMSQLPGEEKYYTARTTGRVTTDADMPQGLVLKEGAQVMTMVNKPTDGFVNGSLGKVVAMHDDYIEMVLEDGEKVKVFRHTWEITEARYNKTKRKIETTVVGTISQIPVKPAWAISIHKSQGMTFNRVKVDFGYSGCFSSGMAYVALSRCTSLQGLRLNFRLREQDILVNGHARGFFEQHFPGRSSEFSSSGKTLRRPRYIQPGQRMIIADECPF